VLTGDLDLIGQDARLIRTYMFGKYIILLQGTTAVNTISRVQGAAGVNYMNLVKGTGSLDMITEER